MRRDPWPACDACGDPAQYSAGGGAAPEFFACVDCLDTVPDDERDSWSEIVAPAEDVDADEPPEPSDAFAECRFCGATFSGSGDDCGGCRFDDAQSDAYVRDTFRARCGLCCICGEEPTADGMDPPGRCVRCARLSRELA